MGQFQSIIENYLIVILAGLVFLLIILLAWNVILQLQFGKIKKRNKIFFSGNKVKNLEELMLSQAQSLSSLDKDIQELYNISNKINTLAFSGLHKVGVIRYNPFRDVGGDQSFSIAFLNGKNNGLTISSLFTREGTRIYSKSIIKGESEKYPLTEEEKKAIQMAIDSN